MRLRPLPFVTQLEQLSTTDARAAQELRDNAMVELVRSPGFQLVVSALQLEQRDAVECVRCGRSGRSLEFEAGRAAAIQSVLNRLTALFPDGSAVDMEPEEELELPLYGDLPAFDIPYPTSGE